MCCYAIFSQDNMHCHFIQKSYIVLVHMANSFYVAIFLIQHMIGPPLPCEKHQTISCQIHPINSYSKRILLISCCIKLNMSSQQNEFRTFHVAYSCNFLLPVMSYINQISSSMNLSFTIGIIEYQFSSFIADSGIKVSTRSI